jgi:hypothetical protein
VEIPAGNVLQEGEMNMPDICMCAHKTCPQRKTCYRHEATPWELGQCYFGTSPKAKGCRYYWPIPKSWRVEGVK